MSQVAIVAIPSQDDYVWKISSEKVPHLTLCVLGELTSNFPAGRIASYLDHVANTTMHQFGLEVDHRGLLGEKNADVLFFRKRRTTEWLEEVRADLLKNRDIRVAYDSTEQFPEWIPHLTLGFPDSPAHPDTRDYPGIQWVNFDRVALWTGDFEGVELRLKENEWGSISMSDQVDAFFAHFGVKGMRWGVKRSAKELHSASPDHSHAQGIKAKGRNSGVKALSNKDIQDYMTRVSLEKQFKGTTPSGKAGAFLSQILIGVGKQQATSVVNTQASKLVADGIGRVQRS